MTTFTVKYLGGKRIRFHDGQTIKATLPSDSFNNLPMGTIHYLIHDKMEFVDDENKLYGIINVGSVKKKSSGFMGSKSMDPDYFEGSIQRDGKEICKINGNYCGYMDIDG